MPSRAASAGDGVLVAGEAKRVLGDLETEVLGHLVVVEHLAHPQGDLVLAAQGPVRAAGGRGDLGQFGCGGRQQFVAFAGAVGGQDRVVAAHQPFVGKVREQISTRSCWSNSDSGNAPACTRLVIWGARSALMQSSPPGRHSSVMRALVGHAPISDQTHPGQPEPVFELGNLGGQGFRVAVLPSNTSMATGTPAGVHSSP